MKVIRDRWLDKCRAIVMAALGIHQIEEFWLDSVGGKAEGDTTDSLGRYADTKIRLSTYLIELNEIEKDAEGKLGMTAMLGKFPESGAIATAVCLLTAKALCSATFEYRLDNVGELIEYAAGNSNGGDLLKIREAMSSHGILRPHVHVELHKTMTRTINELERPVLTEESFSKLLAIEPDKEMIILAGARNTINKDK